MRNKINIVQPLTVVGILVALILGGAVGIGVGGYYAWQVDPLLYDGGALPDELTQNYQNHYLALVIDSYLVNPDVALASDRMKTFDQATKIETIGRRMAQYAAAGRNAEAAAIYELAIGLSVSENWDPATISVQLNKLAAEFQDDGPKLAAITALVARLSQVAPITRPAQEEAAAPPPAAAAPANIAAEAGLSNTPVTLTSVALAFVIFLVFTRRGRRIIPWRVRRVFGSSPDYVIGFDLGTTMSRIVVTRVDQLDGREPLNGSLAEMPTAVIPIIDNAKMWEVGKDAIRKGVDNPLFKLRLGEMNEIDVDSPDPELKQTKLRPEYLAAKLMSALKKTMINQARLNTEMLGQKAYHHVRKISNLTVTVPMGSTFLKREATRFSARVAGWNNIVTLPEPVAAFLYFKHYYEDELLKNAEYFLVFDFGGGTCDISIIHWKDRKSLPYVITGSSATIGGERIDEELWEEVGQKELDEKLWDYLSLEEKADVRRIIKRLKEALNPPNRNEIIDSITAKEIGEALYISDDTRKKAAQTDSQFDAFTLSRTRLDEKVNEIVIPKIEPALFKALERAANIKPDFRIDKILMTGGSSHLWRVQDCIEECFRKWNGDDRISFKKKTILLKEPLRAVAYGAAIHQYYSLRDGTVIPSTLSSDIYIRYQKDHNNRVVWEKAYLGRRGNRLPTPGVKLSRIERMPFQIWYSLRPLRLPSNKAEKNISWPIYKDRVVKNDRRKRIATITVNEYTPKRFTYLRTLYRINQYGDLDLLAPYLTNKRNYKPAVDFTRGDYDFDHQTEEKIREKMEIDE